jgi:signal transduction histidine kinase
VLRNIAGIPWRQWLRPPGHLLVLFLVTTLGFLAALFYVGWRSVQQAEVLEQQRVRLNLESATDLVAAELRRTVSDIEGQLEHLSTIAPSNLADAMSAYGVRLGDDALVVAFDAIAVHAYPRRLLYYPTLPSADEPYLRPFMTARPGGPPAEGEAALEYYQTMTQTEDQPVRAEALLGLARTQARSGRIDAALGTYRQLRQPDVLVDGRPAELLGRLALCTLLVEAKSNETSRELVQLYQDLHSGRWQLTRAAYQHYASEVRDLLDKAGIRVQQRLPTPSAISLASGVDSLWKMWQEQGLTAETAGRHRTTAWQGQPVFLIWRATTERFVALIAGPRFVQQHVVEPLHGLLEQQRVQIDTLVDGEGHVVLPRGASSGGVQHPAVRTADAKLPWTLSVISASGEIDRTQFRTRRQLVILGCTFLALFVLAATYFGIRATAREFEAVRLKSDFVAAVSHEFRTPLTLLRQFSDLLAEDRVSSDQERRLYYAALQRGTRRLTRLVEDLLDFGRMEAGSRAFKLERFVAKDWLESLTKEFQEEIGSRGYVLDVSWSGSPAARLNADIEAVGRAVWNLFDNAVKYSPNCKTIWVTGRFDQDTVHIQVRDRGLGIPPSERHLIFRKFVRGSAHGSQVVKGTGLGLALVEQIVHAHHGTVYVESVVGEGSTFHVKLPAECDEQEEVEHALTESSRLSASHTAGGGPLGRAAGV